MLKRRKRILDASGGTVPIESIREVELISDEGAEGDVYKAEVVFNREGKREKRMLALKKFRKKKPENYEPFGNSRFQLECINRLRGVNEKNELGLNIIPEVFLVEGKKNSDLLLTLLNVGEDLSESEQQAWLQDSSRQIEAAKTCGWLINYDAFLPVRDEKQGVVAVIADFGTVVPPENIFTQIRTSL